MSRKTSDPPHTLLVHGDAGIDSDSSIAPPLYPSVTYRAGSAEEFRAMANEERHPRFYARYGTPTHARVERLLAQLEGAEAALLLASGMAAISSAVLSQVSAGDHVIAQRSHYMGTTQLLTSVLARFAVQATLVEQSDPGAFEAALRPETRLVLLESPSNPLLRLTDLGAIASLARQRGILTLADNTFATPINQQPIALGVDMVVHSATKYLGGHHDLLAGVLAGPREWVQRAWEMSLVLGGNLGGFEAWLLLRGMRTLALRVQRQNETALAIACHLQSHPRVDAVYYPGLQSHPHNALARRQMRGFGGVLAFTLRGGEQAAQNCMQRLQLFAQAVSLGGIESLAIHAATTWSGTLSEEQTRTAGVDPALIRLSVGLEEASDLIEDLDQALCD